MKNIRHQNWTLYLTLTVLCLGTPFGANAASNSTALIAEYSDQEITGQIATLAEDLPPPPDYLPPPPEDTTPPPPPPHYTPPPPPTGLTLTTQAINGTIAVSPLKNYYTSGETINLTATPRIGYRFANWNGGASGSEPVITLSMTVNTTVEAVFSVISDLTLTLVASNGNVSVEPDKPLYTFGERVSLTAMPNPGYRFVGWSGDAGGVGLNLSLVMTKNRNLIATFHQIQVDDDLPPPPDYIPLPPIDLNPPPPPDFNPIPPPNLILTTTASNGTIQIDPVKDLYSEGEEVTLTAEPNTGYRFASWSGNATGSTPTIILVMGGNRSVTANFVLIDNLVLDTTASNGSIAVSPQKSHYTYGDSVTLTAVPMAGYRFVGWTGDVAGSTSSAIFVMTKNSSVTANFELIDNLTVLTTALNGSITINPQQPFYTYSDIITFTAVPEIGYRFVAWSGDVTGSQISRSVMITRNYNLTATFELIDDLTLTTTAQNGSVSRNPSKPLYSYGDSVTVTARPNEGYRFVSWTGNSSGTGLSLDIEINKNHSVTANFEIIDDLVVTTQSINGTILIEPDKNFYTYGDDITLKAEANLGYRFVAWDGGATSTDPQIDLRITQNLNAVAIFELIDDLILTTVASSGSVSVAPQKQQYSYGETVTLTAAADPGYRFVGWSDDFSGNTNPVAIVMYSDRSVRANFQPKPFVSRSLPEGYVSTTTVLVSLLADPDDHVNAYAVEETYPSGWTVTQITESGLDNQASNTIRFGPFFDNKTRTLTYLLETPAQISGEFLFDGKGSANGLSSRTEGDQVLSESLVHPADILPSNWSLSVNEITLYGASWKRGEEWPVIPSPIPIDYVTRAGFLWRSGEHYQITSDAPLPPDWWVPLEPNQQPSHLIRKLATRQGAPTRAERTLYPHWVEIHIDPIQTAAVYAVEEQIPASLSIIEVLDDGVFDEIQRKLKWGPFFDTHPRTLRYRTGGIVAAVSFGGVISVDGVSMDITGDHKHDPQISIFRRDQDLEEPPSFVENGMGRIIAEHPEWIYQIKESRWLYVYGASPNSFFVFDPQSNEWVWSSDTAAGWYFQFHEPAGWYRWNSVGDR